MVKLSRPRAVIASIAGVLLTAGIVHLGGTSAAQQAKVNPDARLLQDFQQRIEKYVELRN